MSSSCSLTATGPGTISTSFGVPYCSPTISPETVTGDATIPVTDATMVKATGTPSYIPSEIVPTVASYIPHPAPSFDQAWAADTIQQFCSNFPTQQGIFGIGSDCRANGGFTLGPDGNSCGCLDLLENGYSSPGDKPEAFLRLGVKRVDDKSTIWFSEATCKTAMLTVLNGCNTHDGVNKYGGNLTIQDDHGDMLNFMMLV